MMLMTTVSVCRILITIYHNYNTNTKVINLGLLMDTHSFYLEHLEEHLEKSELLEGLPEKFPYSLSNKSFCEIKSN